MMQLLFGWKKLGTIGLSQVDVATKSETMCKNLIYFNDVVLGVDSKLLMGEDFQNIFIGC
jgi:hypothetical protein